MARKNAPAAQIREWALANGPFRDENGNDIPVGTRGRPNPVHVAAFRKAHKHLTYTPGSDAEKRTITVRVPFTDKAGRKNSKSVTLTTEEARKALGHGPGATGRISRTALVEALSE